MNRDALPPMSMIARLFRPKAAPEADPREALRPLWHRIVELSRDPRLYRDDGVADTVSGRFDMIAAILVVVLLRFERDRVLTHEAVLLTELFVEDMDGQLRESGVGDLMVGKHMGRLVSVLGGRLGALRGALADADDAALVDAIERNVAFGERPDAAKVAGLVRGYAGALDAVSADDLRAARIVLP